MSGTRFRLVTVQGGREHVSSVLLGRGEVLEHLDAEEDMAHMGGWSITRLHDWGEEFPTLLMLSPRNMVRRIYARACTPFDDSVMLDSSPHGGAISPDSPSGRAPTLPHERPREVSDGDGVRVR